VDHHREVRDFLVSRRARVTPDQVGLPAGRNRRVPGLRRGEVALAGLSVEYYAKIERGAIDGPSEQVLDAIARALQLDDAEREHLSDLARAGDTTTTRRRARRSALEATTRPSLQWALDAVTAGPAFVRNGRMDILAANRLARAFYNDVYADSRRPPNIARFTFLDPAGERFYPDWDSAADICVASCAPKPAAIRMIDCCTISSASSPPAARTSGSGGAATTSATTAPAPNGSTTPSSASSRWPTKASR